MAFNMLYANETLYDVRSVLCAIRDRGGLVPGSFLDAQCDRLQREGSRAADVMNIALVAMGKNPRYVGKATPEQMEILVERAKSENVIELIEIARLREVKGK